MEFNILLDGRNVPEALQQCMSYCPGLFAPVKVWTALLQSIGHWYFNERCTNDLKSTPKKDTRHWAQQIIDDEGNSAKRATVNAREDSTVKFSADGNTVNIQIRHDNRGTILTMRMVLNGPLAIKMLAALYQNDVRNARRELRRAILSD